MQLGTLEIHVWGSRIEALEKPDQVIFDLDPDQGLGLEALQLAACQLRDRLRTLGFASVVKTSGGKGYHVVVPLLPEAQWPEAAALHRFGGKGFGGASAGREQRQIEPGQRVFGQLAHLELVAREVRPACRPTVPTRNGTTSDAGNRRSSSTFKTSGPTAPVAPTTATRRLDTGRSLVAQLDLLAKRAVQSRDRVVHLVARDHARDLDRRGRDHPHVDVVASARV